MQKSTLLLLIVLVAALSVGVWWSNQQVIEFEEALFPGLDVAEVASIRVDNVGRDLQVRLDRDDRGGWKLVDPIEGPADEVMVQTLLDAVAKDRLRLVPGEPNSTVFGFEPPQIVLQLDTRDNERYSVEVGLVDVAANTVHLRVRGKIYRAPLRIHTELTRDLDSYRRPYVFKMRAEEVAELHRTGTPLMGEHRFGYELHAQRDNVGWRLVAPFAAGLHPSAIQLLLTNIVRIPVRAFLSPSLELASLGLDPPRRGFQVVDLGGNSRELQIGAGSGNSDFSCRVVPGGDPFMTDSDSAQRLEIPIELLLDRRLMRAPRELLDRIELVREGFAKLTLQQEPSGWTIFEGAGHADGDSGRATDPRLLEQFLAKLEALLFYDITEIGELSDAEVHARVRFVGAGEEWELRIGEVFDDEGTECYRVQQAGDDVVASLEVSDAKFLKTRVSDLRDHRLTRIDELLVQSLVLTHGRSTRRWNRDDRGKWTRDGSEAEAFEILPLLDPLLHLRADSFASGTFELSDPITVEVVHRDGASTTVVLGRAEVAGAQRSVLVSESEIASLAGDQQSLPEQIQALLAQD